MKQTLNILICGDNSDYYNNIAEFLRRGNHRVRTCRMNEEVLIGAIRREKPDILVLKHCMEGTAIFWSLDPYTNIAVVFVYSKYEIISEAERIFSGGYSIHEGEPFEMVLQELQKHPGRYRKRRLALKPEYRLSALLGYFNIPYYTSGFHYLRAAIMLLWGSAGKNCDMIRYIYPQVAKQFSTTGSCVERSIRHAVSCALACDDFPLNKTGASRQFANSRIIRLASAWLLQNCTPPAEPAPPQETATHTVPTE